MKATLFPEWYTDRVEPWVHYVPVQNDYSDLYDSLLFFAGDVSGKGAHDAMAKKIGLAGREWAHSFWRPEDVKAYMFRCVNMTFPAYMLLLTIRSNRLWLEYARVMDPNRKENLFNISRGI